MTLLRNRPAVNQCPWAVCCINTAQTDSAPLVWDDRTSFVYSWTETTTAPLARYNYSFLIGSTSTKCLYFLPSLLPHSPPFHFLVLSPTPPSFAPLPLSIPFHEMLAEHRRTQPFPSNELPVCVCVCVWHAVQCCPRFRPVRRGPVQALQLSRVLIWSCSRILGASVCTIPLFYLFKRYRMDRLWL